MVKRVARYTIAFILYYSGLIAVLRFLQRHRGTIKILVYHRVNDSLEGSSPILTVAQFKKHMAYLKKHYTTIGLRSAAEHITNKTKLGADAVSVTFDDGYKDVINTVLPIMKQYNIPLTIFLSSGLMGDTQLLWTDALYFYFKDKDSKSEFEKYRENLKHVDNAERLRLLKEIPMRAKAGLMMNWEDVKQLNNENLVEIGAHSVHHPVLTRVAIEEASKEIRESKKDIEEIIGRPVYGFSYPAGKYNEAIKRCVTECGFEYACTVNGRFVTNDSEVYSLGRINIDNCPVFVFAAELCGILNWGRRIIYS